MSGFPGSTKRGELSLFPRTFQVLTPCLHMLPGHTGLKDVETRFRQRYLDLICTPKTREVFQVRTPGGRSPTVRHANLLSPEPISD